jgi:hypothetical protein
MKALQAFKTSGNAHPVKQCHIPQDLNPQQKHPMSSIAFLVFVRRDITETQTVNPDETYII